MATSKPTNAKTQEQLEEELHKLQLSLPKDVGFGSPMYLYEGFWCPTTLFEGVIEFQNTFQAYDTDIILASLPKTGTTWLKSLVFSISTRNKMFEDLSQHPFHTKIPHELIRQLEFINYRTRFGHRFDISQVPSPRFFGTHVPYHSLPSSIKTSKCRVVYVCRNPLDTFVSSWLFYLWGDSNKGIMPDNLEKMEEYLSKFCEGVFPFGPYDDHLLGYWKESMQNPQKVLFLEYEGLKKDPKMHLKKLAKFINCPFSDEEEKGSVIDDIIELCSLENMKEMEVNKSGKINGFFENRALFRKGKVGDWTNYLTPLMAKGIDDSILEKLRKVDFAFTYYQANV